MKYKWGKGFKSLITEDGLTAIPWPPVNPAGFEAKKWIDAGNAPDNPDEPPPAEKSKEDLTVELLLKIAPDSPEKKALEDKIKKPGLTVNNVPDSLPS